MSFGDQDAPGWTGLRRSDGARLRLIGANRWAVLAPAGDITATECPCCRKPLLTARAAQLVANAIYPIEEQPE